MALTSQEQTLAEMRQKIGDNFTQRVRDYEAIHGHVTPAPASAKITKRSTEAQMVAITKRHLIRCGWLPKE